MIKDFIFLATIGIFVFGIFIFGITSVVAVEEGQIVSGDVDDFIDFTIDPTTLDFGQIPFGPNENHPGADVTVDTGGSSTQSGMVMVQADVVSDQGSELFFETLLQMKETSEPELDFETLPFSTPKEIAADDSLVLNTRIFGDTASFGAGPKSGTITYTVTATPPD